MALEVDNKQAQRDELMALESIFEKEQLVVDDQKMVGRFLAHPVLPFSPFAVCYQLSSPSPSKSFKGQMKPTRSPTTSNGKCHLKETGSGEKAEEEAANERRFEVEHLPPIELRFELRPKYPASGCPAFLVSCNWLSPRDLTSVCQKLESLYQETRMEVLFTWFSFLQDEVLEFLKYTNGLEITHLLKDRRPRNWFKGYARKSTENGTNESKSREACDRMRKQMNQFYETLRPRSSRGGGMFDQRAAHIRSGFEIINRLKEYSIYKRDEKFRNKWIRCSICFSQNKGSECVVFSCSHTNCTNCIAEYFKVQIAEGAIHSLKCPETKCNVQATPDMVKSLVSEELYNRYDQLLLFYVLGTMGDIVYCPRKVCQCPVIVEPDSQLACCPYCSYAFCTNCKFPNHGVSPCRLFKNDKERQKMVLKYSESTGAEKQALEKLYGKTQLQAALNDVLCEQLIASCSKPCPHCKANIEKIDGCNKMSCWRCNSYFCWLCLGFLPVLNPYTHFNNPSSKCFNRLFHGVVEPEFLDLDDLDLDDEDFDPD